MPKERADRAFVQRKNVEDQVYDALREAILSGDFSGGERLTQFRARASRTDDEYAP